MSGDEKAATGPAATQHSIQNSTSVEDIRSMLKDLYTRHADVTTRLDSSISSHAELSSQLARLDISRARLGSLAVNARSISHGMLSGAASTAGRISSAVERLDVEQTRVKATIEVVEQVAELKACVLGVVGSMGGPQDWETAAEYLSRASRIAPEVVRSGFAEKIVPTAEVPDSPAVTLDAAAQALCKLFLREFTSAVEDGDGARVTRFFKMFPLIGRSDEGLDAYGKYVCQGVAARARATLQNPNSAGRRDGFFYSTTFTKLFEHIAQVVDAHSALVERHYGAGTMVKVMARLQSEADVQGGIILDTWTDERGIDRMLANVKSYAYTFLVQSFVPKSASASRTQSPAPRGAANVQSSTDDGLEMREVDQVLNEVVEMLGHWSLYTRFISFRAIANENHHQAATGNARLSTPPFLANSSLVNKIAQTLIDPFGSFAMFFVRRSVERAFQLDEPPSGLSLQISKPIQVNPPFITSAVDDVMYIVNQVLQKSLATSQADVVINTVSTVGRVLGSDFIGMIQRKMRDECYPKATVQGSFAPENKILSFLVLINNLDVSVDYLRRVVHTCTGDSPSQQPSGGSDTSRSLPALFPMDQDATSVRKSLLALENGFATKAMQLLEEGLDVSFQEVIKPRMRPMLAEAFRDVDYSSAEESLPTILDADKLFEEATNGVDDGVRIRIQDSWNALTKPIKRILSERNYERLLVPIIKSFSNLLEKRIWSYHGRVNELGAVRLERDISDIANIVVKGENFKLRESFNRCLQIVTIMNMDDEEWDVGTANAVEMTWALTANERSRARTMISGRD